MRKSKKKEIVEEVSIKGFSLDSILAADSSSAGPAEAEGLQAGRVGIGPIEDSLSAAEVVGANVERVGVDSFITEPELAVGVDDLRAAHVDPERDVEFLRRGAGDREQAERQHE